MCEGELQQIHHRGNLDLDESDYFAIIEGKTAELTAVSCRLGASYAGAAESTVAALDRYGRNMGIAFQIADDVLDIWGEERVTGKSLGTDLEKQKLTLPIIHLLKVSDAGDAAAIRGCSPTPIPSSGDGSGPISRRPARSNMPGSAPSGTPSRPPTPSTAWRIPTPSRSCGTWRNTSCGECLDPPMTGETRVARKHARHRRSRNLRGSLRRISQGPVAFARVF